MKLDFIKSFWGGVKFVVKTPMGLLGTAVLFFFSAIALGAPYLAPYNPWKIVGPPFSPPSEEHLLGTNDMGQDLYSELLFGTRISLFVGVTAAFISTVAGTVIGVTSGYVGGFVDRVLTSLTDTILLLPALPMMLVLSVFMGPGYTTIILVITLISWPPVARMIRAQTLSVKSRLYVEAAKAIGAGSLRIILRHIVPNIAPISVALGVLMVGDAMIAEAALSFLGLGDPTQKSWGMMLYWAFQSGAFSYGAWWWIVPPGLSIAIAVFGFASLGYAIEELVNPRLRKA